MATKTPTPAQAQQMHREGKISLAQRNMAYAQAAPPTAKPKNPMTRQPSKGKRGGSTP